MILKSLGASYLAIYLILPSCICQLLAVFGITLHGQGTDEPGFYAPPSFSLVCHCDDDVMKSAESPGQEDLGAILAQSFAGVAPLLAEITPVPLPRGAAMLRAPPSEPLWLGSSLSPQVSCVFLI